MTKCISVQKVNVTGKTIELYISTHSNRNLSAIHGKRAESYGQNPQMGLSYRWYSDCDELSAWGDHCVCTSGNDPSRNGHSNAPLIHHSPSDCFHCTNSANHCICFDKEKRAITISLTRFFAIAIHSFPNLRTLCIRDSVPYGLSPLFHCVHIILIQ